MALLSYVFDEFLGAQIRKIDEVKILTLRNFHRNDEYVWGFDVYFDDLEICVPYVGAADGTGQIQASGPITPSQRGRPVSGPGILLNKKTSQAIVMGLRSVAPPLKPFGIDPITGRHIDTATPIILRLTAGASHTWVRPVRRALRVHIDVENGVRVRRPKWLANAPACSNR